MRLCPVFMHSRSWLFCVDRIILASMNIYYFSGTGNSYYVANRLARELNAAEPKSMVHSQPSSPCDTVVLVFPLYYLSFPLVVLNFLKNLSVDQHQRVIVIVTRAFPPMGGVFAHLKQIWNGCEPHYGSYIDMPSNDHILFGTFNEKKNKRMLLKAEDQLQRIIDDIKNHRNRKAFEPFHFLRAWRHGAFLKRLPYTDRHFHINQDCNGCGICKIVCLQKNITMIDKQPVWQKKGKCQECEACINYCPRDAIHYGHKTKKQRGYVNPNVSINQMFHS